MFLKNAHQRIKTWIKPFYKKSGIYVISFILLFILIGLLTTVKPAYRFSSNAITEWTSDIDSSTFLYLIGTESKAFEKAFPVDKVFPSLSTVFFQIATNIKLGDFKSLLGRELPSFSAFENRIIIAGEGTNHESLSIESSPPLEEILREREAILEEPAKEEEEKGEQHQSLQKKDVVFIYNTHNRESFLPHLPGVTNPGSAHHNKVNITMVSEKFAESLNAHGIGTIVDETDIMNVLQEKEWGYAKSYKASRPVVEEAIAKHDKLQYVFDIHRDSLPRDKTTKEINGESFAKVLIVIGAKYASYEKNLALATELHYLIEERYPGLSRGVLTKEGAGANGIYNQDLSENSLLLEIGGYENKLDELYRTAEVIAEVFSEFYWEAEQVDAN